MSRKKTFTVDVIPTNGSSDLNTVAAKIEFYGLRQATENCNVQFGVIDTFRNFDR